MCVEIGTSFVSEETGAGYESERVAGGCCPPLPFFVVTIVAPVTGGVEVLTACVAVNNDSHLGA